MPVDLASAADASLRLKAGAQRPRHRICSHRLTADELVPVLSYLAQRGRCRACDTPIDRGIPIREALSGLALGLPWAIVGCSHPLFALGSGGIFFLAIWIVQGLKQASRSAPG